MDINQIKELFKKLTNNTANADDYVDLAIKVLISKLHIKAITDLPKADEVTGYAEYVVLRIASYLANTLPRAGISSEDVGGLKFTYTKDIEADICELSEIIHKYENPEEGKDESGIYSLKTLRW